MKLIFRNILICIILAICNINAIANEENDSSSVLFDELIRQYNESLPNEPFVALEIAAQAKQIAEESKDSSKIALAYQNIGRGYYKTKVYYLAMEAQFNAYEIFAQKNEVDNMALCQIDIAQTYFAQEVYELSEEYCSKAIEICKDNNFLEIQANALSLLGNIYMRSDEEEALNNLISARKIYSQLGNNDKVLSVNLLIALAYSRLDEKDSAINILNDCIDKFLKKDDKIDIAKTYHTFARVYSYYDEVNHAVKYYLKAYENYRQAGATHEALSMRARLAILQYENDFVTDALSNAESTLKGADQEELKTGISELDIKSQVCQILYKIYKQNGDNEKALKYCIRYANINDSIYIQKKKEQFSEFQASLESQKQQKQIEAIQYQNERKTFELERQQNNRNILFLIGFILLVIIVVVFVIYRNKEKNKLNKQLSESNTKMLIEIQEKKLAEAELKNSEEKYRLLFRKTPVGIAQFTESFIITAVNERFSQIFELKNQNVIGKEIYSIIPRDIFKGFDISADDQGAKMFKQEHEIKTETGIVYVSITLKPYHYNAGRDIEKGGIMIVENITDRKLAEQNASELTEKRASIINQLPDVIFRLDENGTFIYARIPNNPDAMKQYNGRNIRDKFSADILLQFLVAFNNVRKTGETQFVEYKVDKINEEGKPIYNEARFINAENNTVLLIIRDISRQKEEENFLKNAQINAESGSRAKSEFLLTLTDDIKEPLENILKIAENLSANITQPELSSEITTILKNASSVNETFTDFWNLSRIEAGKQQLYKKTANIIQIANDVFKIFEKRAIEKKLEYIINIQDNIPTNLKLDEVRIRQVLFNIISNAIKYTDNGYVKIDINIQDVSENIINLIIKVTDSGVGLSSEQTDSIFFVGKNNKRSKGMEVTAHLVDIMKGTISVDSTIGQGSIFTVVIPNIDTNIDLSKEKSDVNTDILNTPPDILVNTTRKKKNDSIKEFVDLLKNSLIPEYRILKKNVSFNGLLEYVEKFRETAKNYEIEQAEKTADAIILNIKNLDISSITLNIRKLENYITELTNQ